MVINFPLISNLAKTYGTPFYIAYPERFVANIINFRDSFLKYYKNFILSYSFKTNYAPFILKNVLRNQCFAETVSNMEYSMALDLGFKGDNIIFNGPIKRKEDLYRAIKNHSIIHIDGEYEANLVIGIVKEYKLKDVEIGLRINMEINTKKGESAIQGGLKESRFGLTFDMLERVIPILKNNNIKIISLHGHTSSTNRIVENYLIISERLLLICEKYKLNDLKFFDIGGGFFGACPEEIDTTNRPSYDDYAKGIVTALLKNKWFIKHMPTLIIEPGASVVSNVLELVSQVYQHKRIGEKNFVFLDASVYQIRPIHGNIRAIYPYDCFSNNNNQTSIIADFVGSTCMEVDKIALDASITHYSFGDFYRFKGVGAYRINLTSNFINYQAPIIALYENGDQEIIRPNQNITEVKQIYNL